MTGSTRLDLDGQTQSVDWSAAPQGDALKLTWPDGRSELRAVHAGGGRPWMSVRGIAAVPLAEEWSAERLAEMKDPLGEMRARLLAMNPD